MSPIQWAKAARQGGGRAAPARPKSRPNVHLPAHKSRPKVHLPAHTFQSLSQSLLSLITISAHSCPLPAPSGVSQEMFGDTQTAPTQGAKARANHAAPRPGGPRAAPDRRRASPGGALTAVPAFASAPRVLAPEHRRRREFAARRARRLRAGEEGGGAGTAAPRPTRAPEGRGVQGDARAAAGRPSAAAGHRYARASAARPRCAISRERISPQPPTSLNSALRGNHNTVVVQ